MEPQTQWRAPRVKKLQASTSNIQRSSKLQTSRAVGKKRSASRTNALGLRKMHFQRTGWELGAWNFSGCWMLNVGGSFQVYSDLDFSIGSRFRKSSSARESSHLARRCMTRFSRRHS